MRAIRASKTEPESTTLTLVLGDSSVHKRPAADRE